MTYPYCKPANKRRKTYGEMNEAKQKKNTLALPENSGYIFHFTKKYARVNALVEII